MKIKNEILYKFINKINMSEQVMECKLNFSEDGLHMISNTMDKLSRVNGYLNTTAFAEYEALGSIGIANLTDIKKIIKRFGETISLKVEGNMITISEPGKKVEIPLMDLQFVPAETGEPVTTFNDGFTFPSAKLNEIISDSELSKDSHLIFKTGEGKLMIQNTGKYKFLHEFAIPTCKGGVAVRFGQPFVLAVAGMTENLEFNVSTDYPIKITEKTAQSTISMLIAPLIVKDDD